MAEQKSLGKITGAKFGWQDYSFGLFLTFAGPGWGIGDGGVHAMNMSEHCQYGPGERALEYERVMERTAAILTEAKVENVAQLVGRPVEVTLNGNTYAGFRILAEVL